MSVRFAEPLTPTMPFLLRIRAMARVALAMTFHDKLKTLGTLLGVIFAIVLVNFAIGTFLGLINKNIMFVENAGADLWIVPPGTRQLQGGQQISIGALMAARVTPGVAWADPLIWGGSTVKLPSGGTEAVTVIGTPADYTHGGPWNFVAGSRAVLAEPDTMIFEDSDREKLGGLNIGDTREIGGRNMHVGGFTYGLLPFGPSYAFVDYDTARMMMHVDNDREHYVMVGLLPGANLEETRRVLQAAAPEAMVVTKSELRWSTIAFVLEASGIGQSIGMIVAIGLVVGFVIVSLTMFSAVVDNIREFGTLKAIGATNVDLALILFVQSLLNAVFGSVVGLAIVAEISQLTRNPKVAMIVTWQVFSGSALLITLICVLASSLALARLRKLEPAMVFR